MKLAISEEKINIEAAALEICRNEIMFDLEAELKFSIEPIECYKLQTMLEDYLLDRNYMSIREKIVSNMTSAEQTQIPDYKVEMYLRNFIIEPLLEDNYQRLLATLRLVINEQFIPQFPITTTVLEDSIVQTFNLRRNDLLPVQAMYSTIETFLPVLNIATNFDSLCSAISREVNYFEHLVHSVPQQIDILSRLTQESIMIVKTLEFNCWILLDLCCKVLNTVINNYRLDILLTVDEIAKLRLDFKDYSRQRIVQDKRYLNKLSPNSLNNSINGYCKEAWSRIRKKITNDLAVREKNKVNLPFSERAMFKHSFFKHFKDDAEIIMTQKIGIVPREDVFLYNNYQKVSQNIDTMIDDCFHQMVISMKDTSEALKVQIQDMLTNIYQPSTILRYKWFQLTPKFNLNEVLSLVNRKTIVLCALVATPKTYFVDEYRSHLDHIAHIAADLEVLNEPEIKDMFKIVDNFESRKKNKAFLNAQVKKNEQTFKSNHSLKLPEITYLILGLYFLVTDAGKDIEEMRRAFENNDIIRLSHPCYTKRRLLFQIIRSLKNGQFFLLNYSLVHMIELFLDRQRMTHNRYMSEKVWKKNISDIYVTEYNDVIKRYKEMKTAKLVALVEQVDNGLNDPQRAKRDLLFKSNFISDTKFNDQDLVINSDKTPMLCVNKSRTIETITESTMRGPHNLSRNLSRNSSRLSTDSGIGSPLLNCSIMSGMSEKEIEEDQDLKFHGKLQYLQENIRTYEFIPLQKEKNARSRYPIMVLSGFMSENSNKLDDWKQMLELFPYTEIVTINWESLTPAQIASNFFHSFRKVSVGSISSLIAGQLHTILSKKEATIIEEADTNQQIDPNANPFERGLQEQELEDSGVPRENTEEATTGGIFGLLKMAKFKDIFNTKNLTLAALNITKASSNPVGDQYKNVDKNVPAAALTTGIYDFYRDNPFTQAYHHAVLGGQMLALMMARSNLFNSNPLSVVGFSLGSVLTYSACCTLYDLECRDKIGDVLLIGSTVDLMSLGQNIHKLIGSKGVIQGKLTVCYTIHDNVLAYLFRSARLGESPIGLKRINHEYLLTCLRENDPELSKLSYEDLESYLYMKFENIDVSKTVSGHLDYRLKLLQIFPRIDFNSDLQYYKERS